MLTVTPISETVTQVPVGSWSELKNHLPSQIRVVVETLSSEEEQILFALSMIAASSALFTELKGRYHQRKTYSNLFLITVAPPASGKGLMAGARVALGKIHEHLLKHSKTLQVAYKEQVTQALKTKATPPDKVPFVILFLPGNTSSSRMIEHIKDNGTYPILILETEAGTLATANKSQYGDFSDLVRKAFQGEPISYTRKFNNEFIEVNEPKLAIVLSGTTDQIIKLIGTPEDGTFSRYMFYSFNGKAEWQDANCKDCLNFSDLLYSQQDDYFKLWKFYSNREVMFDLTDRQWEELNTMFRQELESVAATNNVYALGVVKRHGLMLYKMCMTLTAFRMYNLNNQDSLIECMDQDFEVAKYLVSTSIDSSMAVLDQLPSPQSPVKSKDKKQEFSFKLKETFTRAEAVELSSVFKVTPRTIDRWLEKLVSEGKLTVEEHGHYQKC